MSQILSGKPLVADLKSKLQHDIHLAFPQGDKYLAIVFLGDNAASRSYVSKKQAFGLGIGLKVEIFGQGEAVLSQDEGLQFYQKQHYDAIPKVLELIQFLNYDDDCVGIIVQLPVPPKFAPDLHKILATISPHKDADGLGGVINGLSQVGVIDFLPATPRSVLSLLAYYGHSNFDGKVVAIVGQSNLIGKPLSTELMKKGATIISINIFTPPQTAQKLCTQADYIISATGHVGLITPAYIDSHRKQVVIDVGYGIKDGKAVGDVDAKAISEQVSAYSPVPGGVGPVTIACLFQNILDLYHWKL